MNATQARSLSALAILSSFGFRPIRETPDAAWFRSPLRPTERTPSFKVCKRRNLWYDHGAGQGGNALDLACKLYGVSDVGRVSDLLREGQGAVAVSDQSAPFAIPPSSRLQIVSVGVLKDPQLIDYLNRRRISLALGRQWLCEARYSVGPHQWSALGFLNDLGGLELRSRAFKGCSAPKASTWIRVGSDRLTVFEGFFDFLSWLTLREIERPDCDVVVLNSLSFARKVSVEVAGYARVDSYLDNDTAGRTALTHFPGAVDYGAMLGRAKDLNEWLSGHLKR